MTFNYSAAAPSRAIGVGTDLAHTEPVTLRIAVVERDAVRHVHVEGWLTGEEVGELERVVRCGPAPACLELESLRSADADGLAALRRLRKAGVELRSVPPHLAWRIEDER